MKKTIFALALLFGLLATAQAQVITNFGSTAFTDDTGWTWTPGTSTLTGTEGAGFLLYGTPFTANLTGATSLSITANATTAPSAGFNFVLEDNTGKTATALYSWLAFQGGTTTISSVLNAQSGFSFANVTSWNLVSGGSGSSINVALSSVAVSAVPEPATYAALFGLASLGFCIMRKRRKA